MKVEPLSILRSPSDKFADAIVAGLQAAAPVRPANAQAFLNKFPGYENVKLKSC